MYYKVDVLTKILKRYMYATLYDAFLCDTVMFEAGPVLDYRVPYWLD